jgi:hypothetical protein
MMKAFLRAILLIGIIIQTIACVAIPGPGVSNTTPTKTKVISALEQTPGTLPGPKITGGNRNDMDCLRGANGIALTGQPCIQGTYDIHYDVTTKVTPQNTRQVHSPLNVQFSLWAIAPGQLKGTAHLTYSVNATIIDTEGTGCKVQTEVVKPFSWDVELKGQYFTEPDGGVRVVFQAAPPQGPSYIEKFEDCPVPEREAPGVMWQALSGKLINGVYALKQDIPLPADSTGESYSIIHMEVVQAP